jgi:hypothetical protein
LGDKGQQALGFPGDLIAPVSPRIDGIGSIGAQALSNPPHAVARSRRWAGARRFRIVLEQRLGQFGLEVAPEKTKVIAFGA